MVKNSTNISKTNYHLIKNIKDHDWHMMLEIQVLTLDRHKYVIELNRFLDNWTSNSNANLFVFFRQLWISLFIWYRLWFPDGLFNK